MQNQKVKGSKRMGLDNRATGQQKERVKKELSITQPNDLKKLESQQNHNPQKNNYFHVLNIDQQTDNTQRIKQEHSLDLLGNVDNVYCQKCHRGDRAYCIHKIQQVDFQQKVKIPLTSNQMIGWLPPVDDLNMNLGIRQLLFNGQSSFRKQTKIKKN